MTQADRLAPLGSCTPANWAEWPSQIQPHSSVASWLSCSELLLPTWVSRRLQTPGSSHTSVIRCSERVNSRGETRSDSDGRVVSTDRTIHPIWEWCENHLSNAAIY